MDPNNPNNGGDQSQGGGTSGGNDWQKPAGTPSPTPGDAGGQNDQPWKPADQSGTGTTEEAPAAPTEGPAETPSETPAPEEPAA